MYTTTAFQAGCDLNRQRLEGKVGGMLAIIFGLFASFWFAASMILINRGVLLIDYFRGLLTNLGLNALFLWLYIPLFGEIIDLWNRANLIFVLVGIFVPGVARFFMFKGMERLGASITLA
jgi:drug/metabolite transporter (DMT)-like permease